MPGDGIGAILLVVHADSGEPKAANLRSSRILGRDRLLPADGAWVESTRVPFGIMQQRHALRNCPPRSWIGSATVKIQQ